MDKNTKHKSTSYKLMEEFKEFMCCKVRIKLILLKNAN